MRYIRRHMESRILELSCSYYAILLTGPRQAGKTTMLRKLAEKENIGRKYVTLDDLTERDIAKNDPALLSLVGRTLLPGQTFFPDAVLLGCTHFRRLSPLIAPLFPGVPLYDCGEAAASALTASAEGQAERGEGKLRVLVSDGPERFRRAAERVAGLLGVTVEEVPQDE